MTIRPIVIHGEPVLHNPTQPVEESEISTPEMQQLIADMYETCLLYTSDAADE